MVQSVVSQQRATSEPHFSKELAALAEAYGHLLLKFGEGGRAVGQDLMNAGGPGSITNQGYRN